MKIVDWNIFLYYINTLHKIKINMDYLITIL